MKKFLLYLCITIFTINAAEAQSAKKIFRIGNKQLKENKINEAKASFSHAIKLDANFVDAYEKRAEVYMRLGKKDEAIADLDIVNKLDVKNAQAWLQNGNLNFNKEDYTKASTKYAGYLTLEAKDLSIYDREISCLKNIEDYNKALFYAKKKLEVKESPQSYFEIASLQYILKNYSAAETNYRNALKKSPNNIDYHNGLALTLYFQERYDAAIGETNQVLMHDKNNKQALLTRTNSYHKKIEYTHAINDISKVIVLYPNDDDILDNINLRGDLYQEFSQHMNAISDYSRVIGKDPNNSYALYKRAQAYEEITRKDEAIKDFARIVAIAGTGVAVSDDILSSSKTKLYNLKRESNAPIVELTNDNVSEGNIRVTFDMQEVELNIHVKDDNAIKSVMVDGTPLKIEGVKDEANFVTTVSLVDKDKIVVIAKDTYDNKSNTEFYIQRVENDPPEVSFMIPYTNENNEMILEGDDSRVYFEGNVKDESLIKSISIDDVLIPFNTKELNPSFSTNLDLQNKTSILIKVTDIYNNVAQHEYFLNREDALYMADSPMGKTWVVFLENSNYKSFASLDGPVKDIRLMKTALANYEVHNIIHRKDLSKAQMERFFSIELRDLVKKNHVKSLVVWYAGHGKFQNETGYWIPVDADRNDEFSYFNINNLKAAMQVYNTELTHTLVITDACESGPSFYQAMRGEIQVRTCGDEDAIKFKSSQVFSSAGYELAADNSQFTRTFANSLENNNNTCIPIESIVLKVDDAFSQDKQQKPQFGKIAGLQDENGTFFFIKRQANKPVTPPSTPNKQEK